MIQRIVLTNYGPFERAELELGPLTVIVGPNASGKTKLLEAFQVGNLHRYDLKKLSRKGAESHEVSILIDDSKGNQGQWRLAKDDLGEFEMTKETRGVLFSTRSLKLNIDRLRHPSYIDSDMPLMGEDGYGLATNLLYLKVNDDEAFRRILEQTRAIVPTFEGLRFKRTQVKRTNGDKVYGDELIFDIKGAPELTPDAVSDGTMLTLGLITCTAEHTRRRDPHQGSLLFLIDDLEHGLHPRALGELVHHLRLLAETSSVQILATSHSPYLLDALKPEEVRLTGILDDGSAAIQPLTAHPDFERWKDEMTPGEIWSLVGEDWIK